MDIIYNLGKGGIKDARVFLINSHRTDTFDFEKLQMSFIQTVSDLKRDAMILSLTTHSKEILERKVDVLRKHIPTIAHSAGLAASLSKTESDERPEITLLLNEARLYAIQLGINIESLNTVAKNFRMDVSVIKKAVNMQSPALLSSERSFLQYYKTFDDCYRQSPDKISSGDLGRNVQSQCKTVLKNILDMCISESNKLHLQIADLSELESA
ncbi:hypothetical protein DPMN_074802 [Dreissena polymorpha]|uniref:Uncharacterized protein n=1 Tax=Dreissena polymorpha TaxID=45954 RepID=A0A9D4BEC8_DREPO|nr:hypothetical protein DPMN_074802 [Dreissena polymorpha]